MDAPPRRSILGATRHLRGMPRRWRQRRWRHENQHGIPPNNRRQAVQRLGSTSDVVLAESLTSYLEIISDCLDEFPGIRDLQARVISEQGIAAYLRSPNRWRRPDDQYVIDVAAVLERALPAHMPDPERFVVS